MLLLTEISPKKVEHKFDSIFTNTNTDAKSNDKIRAENTKIKNNLDNFVDPMGNQDWWNKLTKQGQNILNS